MTNDWPRDPAALARACNATFDEVLIRTMNRGGGQKPLHVPADAVDMSDRERPTPDDPDEYTTLCAAYAQDDQFRDPVRKPIKTQSNRTQWCHKCAAVLADLPPHSYFSAAVEPSADVDGDPVHSKTCWPEKRCPLCDEAVGKLPHHIRHDCEGAA